MPACAASDNLDKRDRQMSIDASEIEIKARELATERGHRDLDHPRRREMVVSASARTRWPRSFPHSRKYEPKRTSNMSFNHWERHMTQERVALFMCAASCQGGNSTAGKAASEALGVPYPIRLESLAEKAIKEGLDPDNLWPWAMKNWADRPASLRKTAFSIGKST